MSDPFSAIGSVVGGLFGGSDSGGSQQTASKEPWAPAAPWLENLIQDGQDLQGYYQRNPFNPLQQTGYQNLYSDLDNFRSNIAPGLMNFANGMMGSRYQRAPAGSELGSANPYAQQGMPSGNMNGAMMMGGQGGLPSAMSGLGGIQGMTAGQGSIAEAAGQMPSAGGSAPTGALAGLMGGMDTSGMQGNMAGMQSGLGGAIPMPKPAMEGGLLAQAMAPSQGNQGVFGMAPGSQSYGLLNFNGPGGLNPWTDILAQREADKAKKPEKPDLTNDEIIEDYLRRRDPQAWQEWDQSRRLGQGGA